ncbi:hypothetical protein Pmani_030231 [Petrolisthes manimaculis]|uniref:Uncharacterized protein n=1 Tax=Petrolisthes manimaculis TaxID=1843537 RepID=A0AAE1TTU4_9EUCA|nr:hypothetical protein Pmani_030231 [Petrolisthes manimaculis]
MAGCGAVCGTISRGKEGGGVLFRTPKDDSLPGPTPRPSAPGRSPVLPSPTPFTTLYTNTHTDIGLGGRSTLPSLT